MSTHSCAIIIPVFNQERYTEQCLDAIRRNTRDYDYEVIVVDNGSRDGTPEMLERQQRTDPRLRVIRLDHNQGYVAANNIAAQNTTCEQLLFLNNDTIPRPGWLSTLATALTRDGAAAAGSKLVYPETNTINHAGYAFSARLQSFYPIYCNLHSACPLVNRPRRLEALLGACLLVPRTVFFEVGMFTDIGLEDVDLCLKIGAAGGAVLYQPQSEVCHYGSVTIVNSPAAALPSRDTDAFSARWTRERIRLQDEEIYAADGVRCEFTNDGRCVLRSAAHPSYDCLAKGLAAFEAKQYAEAHQVLLQAAVYDPRNMDALLLLTEVAMAMNDLPGAIRWTQQVVDADPHYLEGRFLLGRYFSSIGERNRGRAYLEALIDLPDAPFQLKERAQAEIAGPGITR